MKTKYLILIALAFLATSCTKPYHEYRLNDETKSWFIDDDKCQFEMRDENGVTYSFSFASSYAYMMDESSHFIGVLTDEAHRESWSQAGSSSYNMPVLLCATAGWGETPNEDDSFSIDLGNAQYGLSMRGDEILPQYCIDMGGGVEGMEFEVEYFDQYWVHDVKYLGVMRLKLVDLSYPQSKFFPTEIYYAKHFGLIQCTLDGDLTFYRIPSR